jgi:hypothetical protein
MKLANLLLRVRGTSALTDPEVVQALRLSDTQVVRIKDVQRQCSASLRDRLRQLLRTSGSRQRSLISSLRELHDEAHQGALCVLSEEQKKELARLQDPRVN